MGLTDLFKGEQALLEKGKEYLKDRDYDKAIYYFEKVLKKNENNLSAAYNKGVVFIKQENYKRARTHFEKLLEKYPKSKQVLEAMAFVLEKKEEYQEADKCYERILKLKKYSDDLPILNKRTRLLDKSIEYLSGYGRADEKEIKEIKEKIIDCSNKILKIISEIEPYKKDEKIINIQKYAEEIKEKYINDLANS